MQLKASEKFGQASAQFINALKDEDYEDEGTLDLVQLKEVITSEFESID
jgi:hypothetical protein